MPVSSYQMAETWQKRWKITAKKVSYLCPKHDGREQGEQESLPWYNLSKSSINIEKHHVWKMARLLIILHCIDYLLQTEGRVWIPLSQAGYKECVLRFAKAFLQEVLLFSDSLTELTWFKNSPVGCTVFPVAVDAGDEVMNTKEQTWNN